MVTKSKRPPPPPDSNEDQQPSHEEEQEDDEEEEGSTASSDEQEDQDDAQNYRLSRAPNKPDPKSPSSSGSGSDSATASDSEPDSPSPADIPNPKAKPQAASEPKQQPPKALASKRPAENNGESKDSKKTKVAENHDGASKKLFQRIFSDEDEITILEGMVEFISANGGYDPYKYADAFHDFLSKRSSKLKPLGFDVSSSQLKEKIRRMKGKYWNNSSRGMSGFSKPHEQRAFELAQVVWGGGAGTGGNSKTNTAAEPEKEINGGKVKVKAKAKAEPNSEDSNEFGKIIDEGLQTSLALSSMIKYDKDVGENRMMGEDFLRKGYELMEISKKVEFEGKWRKLEAVELDLRVKRAELYANHAKAMLQENPH